jgi:hypothetical protein
MAIWKEMILSQTSRGILLALVWTEANTRRLYSKYPVSWPSFELLPATHSLPVSHNSVYYKADLWKATKTSEPELLETAK